MRRTITRALAALGIATAAIATAGTGTAGAADGSWDGCPYGAVCIYPPNQDPENNPHPTDVYWSYGAHNLAGQYGNHWVYNNQSGGAHSRLCRGANGTDCVYDLAAGYAVSYDLGPINSPTLDRP